MTTSFDTENRSSFLCFWWGKKWIISRCLFRNKLVTEISTIFYQAKLCAEQSYPESSLTGFAQHVTYVNVNMVHLFICLGAFVNRCCVGSFCWYFLSCICIIFRFSTEFDVLWKKNIYFAIFASACSLHFQFLQISI